MQKREKVPATSGQTGEIAGAFIGEMNLSKSEASAIIGNMGRFRADVRKFWTSYRTKNTSIEELTDLTRWASVYKKLFGKLPDFSTLSAPAKPEGLGPMRLIVVAKEIVDWTDNHSLQGTMEALKKHFKCWQYTDNLDETIVKNDRDPKNGSYAIWVKDVREADEGNANKSANDLAGEKHLGITLLERLLLEGDYFFEHGEHLDTNNLTLCSGSRSRDGGVPRAYWCDGLFGIGWCYPSYRNTLLRSRSVIL